MDRTNIGYMVKTKDDVKNIVLEANELNSKMMKNDLVIIIIEQDISGKHFVDSIRGQVKMRLKKLDSYFIKLDLFF